MATLHRWNLECGRGNCTGGLREWADVGGGAASTALPRSPAGEVPPSGGPFLGPHVGLGLRPLTWRRGPQQSSSQTPPKDVAPTFTMFSMAGGGRLGACGRRDSGEHHPGSGALGMRRRSTGLDSNNCRSLVTAVGGFTAGN